MNIYGFLVRTTVLHHMKKCLESQKSTLCLEQHTERGTPGLYLTWCAKSAKDATRTTELSCPRGEMPGEYQA